MSRNAPKHAEKTPADQLTERLTERQDQLDKLLAQADQQRADTGGSLTGYTKALAWAFDQVRLELKQQFRDEPEKGVLNAVQLARDLLETARWVPAQDPTATATVRRIAS